MAGGGLGEAQPVDYDGSTLVAGASAGIAFLADREQADAQQVLRVADEALYRAKRAQKGTVELTDVGEV